MPVNSDINKLKAINEAIWIIDHAANLDKETLFKVIADLGEYQIFSARQIESMANGLVSHQTVSKLCNKSDKTGGRLQIEDLRKIRDLFYGKSNGIVNYNLVKEVVSNGTSQGMVSKLTGIPQGSISKMIKENHSE